MNLASAVFGRPALRLTHVVEDFDFAGEGRLSD